jgi:hypothetical protein
MRGAVELAGVAGAEGEAEFLQAGAEHVLGVVEHGEAALQTRIPKIGPARRSRPDTAVINDSGAEPHVGDIPVGGRGPRRERGNPARGYRYWRAIHGAGARDEDMFQSRDRQGAVETPRKPEARG